MVASMVLEAGGRWGECATPQQWADMEALLDGTGLRRHAWLRPRGHSKPLALDTPLPTPSGWTTMGEVAPGDYVISEAGEPARVTYTSPVLLGEDCWRVTFDDGSSVVASGGHEWVAEDHLHRARRNDKGLWSAHMVPGGVASLPVMTTREIAASVRYGPRGDLSVSVPCARQWDLPESELPLPPYVLGAWLGDGSSHTGMITVGDEDLGEVSARFAALGWPLHSPVRKPGAACATWRFGSGEGTRKNGRGPRIWSSTRILGEMGLIGSKHIPAAYLRASAKQRLELLRGLMDTDGNAAHGQAVFNSTADALAAGVAELVVSMGWKARSAVFRARLNGRDCGAYHKVTFRPDVSPFALARKTERIRLAGRSQMSRHASRMVTSVEPVPPVPVRCISVDAPSRLYLAGRSGIPTHNTFDAGAATIAMMLCGGIRAGDEMYAAAAGKDQAGLLARKIAAIISRTPGFARAVEVQQNRVITPPTGAVLEVLSAELPGSWGKTPRWLFFDEFCNHEAGETARMFAESLLTSLVKRRDSVCLAASTPSSPQHWSYDLWTGWQASRLWRTSQISEPAPWQDPEELAEEAARLPEFLFRRLFLCEWAAADDALADSAALAACTRHSGPLPYARGTAYVVSFDLGIAKDYSAVCVAHEGERDGKREVVIDRLQAWAPPKGGQVDLADVMAFIEAASREYGGAPVVGDPWQAWKDIQGLRQRGFQVKAARYSPQDNSRRAQLLTRLVRDHAIDLPDDPDLRREFLSLRLAEGSTPGVVKLIADGTAKGHFDRVQTVMLAAEELMVRPSSSWRDYCGDTRECQSCQRVYLAAAAACRWCQAPNPERPAQAQARPLPSPPVPGSWASAYLPADARTCPQGHRYAGSHGDQCPRCHHGGLPYQLPGLPASFAAFRR